ncbi:stAR-related lipid transfer protein 7, mitochondrial [Diachasma alloeum]|uniref:stAR-related lipid transfer protein 7, mitochondrial n=1 Tax=Diachasma alloeum TaxID=454923 RepID=UPI000738204C|nr:stAR-related lipid transfer protein 7, mitochondrial [Diachasma alloeum]
MNISTALWRQLSPKNGRAGSVTYLTTCRHYSGYTKRMGIWLRDHSIEVTNACTRQLEFIVAQRVRRSLQLFELWTKIWDDVALKEFLRAWRRRARRSGRELLFSSVGVTMFNWERDRIDNEELYSYANEIETIHKLKETTVVCEDCRQRLVIDKAQPGVEYCECKGKAARGSGDHWEPFIERRDMLIWRREEPGTGGLYAYKVLGTFSDVSADEFLRVQVDVQYRKEWDTTAKRLEIIDTDPQGVADQNQRSDVIYWEMIWPRLFSNRDYVYQRRWVLDKEKGIVVIVSRGIQHPAAPDRPDTYRVNSYWSYMVIKPCKNFGEPGIEFGLTYFEDPGINIPYAVSAWVAMSGLPDFLNKMRQAAKDYKYYIAKNQKPEEVPDSTEEIEASNDEITLNCQPNDVVNEPVPEEIVVSPTAEPKDSPIPCQGVINPQSNDPCEVEVQSTSEDCELSEQMIEKQSSYLRYIFLTKLFA